MGCYSTYALNNLVQFRVVVYTVYRILQALKTMSQLNTPNETRDLDEALDYANDVIIAIANEKNVNLSDQQRSEYAALVISNNFNNCAEELWDAIIAKLFGLQTADQGASV